MENFFYLVVGMLLMYLILQKPLQITIKHIVENNNPKYSKEEIEELEKEMLKEDPEKENMYDKLDEVLVEVNNVMGGSDR